MIAVSDMSRRLGDYQRPYLTVFRVEKTPDDYYLQSNGIDTNRVADLRSLLRTISIDKHSKVVSAIAKQNEINRLNEMLINDNINTEYQSSAWHIAAINADIARLESEKNILYGEINSLVSKEKDYRTELSNLLKKLNGNPELLTTHYPLFEKVQNDIDIYSLRTVMPDRKSELNNFWWEGELFHIPGRDTSPKESEFTFILDQDMLLLPFLYTMKDLTGTSVGQYRAPRGNVYADEYSQEFDFGISTIATDRFYVTSYVRLIGVRIYDVGGIKVDKSDTGTTVQTVTVKCAWDYTLWDDSRIGRSFSFNNRRDPVFNEG